MPRRKFMRPLPPQAEAAATVEVKTTDAAVDWLILEIEVIGGDRLPAIALDQNTTTSLTLGAGTYRFWFYFEKISAGSRFTLQIATNAPDSPFPAEPKTVTAAAGARGQTSTKVVVA